MGAISNEQIDEILALYDPYELQLVLGPQWRGRMRDIAAEELAELGVGASFELVNPLIEDHVRLFGLERLKVPIGTSLGLATAQIEAGVAAGESIGEIARRLVSVGATDQTWRANMIARTEVARSSNIARKLTWNASGLPGLKKQWLSSLQETTRDSHAALHNKAIDLNAVFNFSAGLEPGVPASTQTPGDSGVGAHDINCTCTVVAFDPEHGKSLVFGGQEHIAKMKAFDQLRSPWEKEAVKAIAEYYSGIERRTLEILRVNKEDL